MDENNPKLIITSIEKSNLFQRRLHHEHDGSHNYDFIGSREDVQLTNHKSNTNTLKADNNDNVTKSNNLKTTHGGGAQMGKSVKFEINKGSVWEEIDSVLLKIKKWFTRFRNPHTYLNKYRKNALSVFNQE